MRRTYPLGLDLSSRRLDARLVPPERPLRELHPTVDFAVVLGLVADRYAAAVAPLDQPRDRPFGGRSDSAAGIQTDRLFTGRTWDGATGRYWLTSRYDDPGPGRFIQPDAIVPDPTNPQALNRYADAPNNPLTDTDPTGRAPKDWDPTWVAAFNEQHPNANGPTERDWRDYQLRLSRPGTGPAGSWTQGDWATYTSVRDLIGAEALSQIGRQGGGGTALDEIIGGLLPGIDSAKTVRGPDGTRIVLNSNVLPGAGGTTFGNTIYISPGWTQRLQDPQGFAGFRALLVHEYVHILDYRAQGASYIPDYVLAGRDSLRSGDAFGGRNNVLEARQYAIEEIYRANPWLPGPWEFPR